MLAMKQYRERTGAAMLEVRRVLYKHWLLREVSRVELSHDLEERMQVLLKVAKFVLEM